MKYIVWELQDDNSLTKITDNYPVKGTNNAYSECLYAPWGTDAVKVNFLPQRFYDLNGVNPITSMKAYQETDQEIIDSIVPTASQKANYGLWYFPMLKGLTSILQSYNQSQYKLAFERLSLEDDPEYLGEYAYFEYDIASINDNLDTLYPDATANNYVNVYITGTNTYASYVLGEDGGFGAIWTAQSSVLNESIIDRTETATETIKGTVFGNEDYTTEYDPSELANVLNTIYVELAEFDTMYSSLVAELPNYMKIEDYDSESGIATSAVKYATNLRGTTDIDADTVIDTLVSLVDKDISLDEDIADLVAKDIALDEDIVADRVRLSANELDIDNLELANMFKSVSFASATGIITFTLYDDTTTSINLPTELIVSGGSYDPTTKDLTLVLASGDEIVIPLDDILTGVATETYVQTQLESYYTKTEANSAFLEADTTKTSELINDGDGTSNFITASQLGDAGYGDMTELEYAKNGIIGVVDTSIQTVVIPLTYDTAGKFYGTITGNTPTTNREIIFLFPDTTIDDTETVTISIDGGSTYKPFKYYDTGNNVLVKHTSLLKTRSYYNGTNWYTDGVNLATIEQVITARTDSSLTVGTPIQGTAELTELQGGSLRQEVVNGNFEDGTTNWTASNYNLSIENNMLKATVGGLVGFARINQTLENNTVIGQKYYYEYSITPKYNTDTWFQINGIEVQSRKTPIANENTKYYGIFTETVGGNSSQIYHRTDNQYSLGDIIYFDTIKIIPISNTKLASYTDAQILELFDNLEYKEIGTYSIPEYDTLYDLTSIFAVYASNITAEYIDNAYNIYIDPYETYYNTYYPPITLDSASPYYYYDDTPAKASDFRTSLDDKIESIGIDTQQERVIIAFLIMAGVAVGLGILYKSIPVVILAELMLIFIFTVLGWFNLWFIIIIALTFVLLILIKALKGGK